MRQSQLFTRTRKEAPSDEVSKNAKLLIRAGYIHKEMAGVYTYLPLGLRVLHNISNIIREEMDAVGGQETHLTVLQESDVWKKTGRWDDEVVDDWFKTELKGGGVLGLGFTHEEPLAELLKNHLDSYKDLPIFPYQIQTKFRNELRAKSGIMRGREFLMKDMYSFTRNEEETDAFHEKVKDAYMNIFERCGIRDKTYLTISSGGSFSKYSHEFQTVSEAGEDNILVGRDTGVAINKDDYSDELLEDFSIKESGFDEYKSIEVGDIYKLGTKYSEALGLYYKDEKGDSVPVDMGSYGIGIGRLMGTIVETLSDEKGIVWPDQIAPFAVHLISLNKNEEAKEVYEALRKEGFEVLFDDRDMSLGAKFGDSDLLGIPYRVVVSAKTLQEGKIEVKNRKEDNSELVNLETFIQDLKK